MKDAAKQKRPLLHVMLTSRELDAVDKSRGRLGVRTRTAAVRKLLQLGLRELKLTTSTNEASADHGTKPLGTVA